MGARETTPTTNARPGQTSPATSTQPNPREAFLASDHRPPLAGIKLVRPRPRLQARRYGRSSLTPARATAQTGSDEESHNHSPHPQPGGPGEQVTGSIQHALLTTRAPMGAVLPVWDVLSSLFQRERDGLPGAASADLSFAADRASWSGGAHTTPHGARSVIMSNTCLNGCWP